MTGWGQHGPLAHDRRARPELRLARRRAARPGPGRRPPAVPDEPARRLRWRVDVPRHRGARRAPRGPGRAARGRSWTRRSWTARRTCRRCSRACWPAASRTSARAANLLDGGAPFYDVYETADGRHMSVGALEPQFYAVLVELLALPDLPDRNDLAQWPALREAFTRRFKERTQAEWTRGLRRHRRLRRAGPAADRGGRGTRTWPPAARTSTATASCSRRPRRGSPGPERP